MACVCLEAGVEELEGQHRSWGQCSPDPGEWLPIIPCLFLFLPWGRFTVPQRGHNLFLTSCSSRSQLYRSHSARILRTDEKQPRTHQKEIHLEESENLRGQITQGGSIKGASWGFSVTDEARNGNPKCHHYLWCIMSEKQASFHRSTTNQPRLLAVITADPHRGCREWRVCLDSRVKLIFGPEICLAFPQTTHNSTGPRWAAWTQCAVKPKSGGGGVLNTCLWLCFLSDGEAARLPARG